MKRLLLKNQRKIVLISSIAGLILFVILLMKAIASAIRISNTNSELLSELSVMILWILLIIPSLLGLFNFAGSSAGQRLTVCILYLIYLVSNLLTYLAYFTATDALEAGIMFVILGIPVSVIVSIVLLFLSFKK